MSSHLWTFSVKVVVFTKTTGTSFCLAKITNVSIKMIDRSGVMVKYTSVNKGIVLQMTKTCVPDLNQHPLLFLESTEIPIPAMRFQNYLMTEINRRRSRCGAINPLMDHFQKHILIS